MITTSEKRTENCKKELKRILYFGIFVFIFLILIEHRALAQEPQENEVKELIGICLSKSEMITKSLNDDRKISLCFLGLGVLASAFIIWGFSRWGKWIRFPLSQWIFLIIFPLCLQIVIGLIFSISTLKKEATFGTEYITLGTFPADTCKRIINNIEQAEDKKMLQDVLTLVDSPNSFKAYIKVYWRVLLFGMVGSFLITLCLWYFTNKKLVKGSYA